MADVVAVWQTLVPGNLPTKHLDLLFSDFNPLECLTSFDFAGFVNMNEVEVPNARANLQQDSIYLSPNAAEKAIAGRNHYGTLFSIVVSANSIAIEDYCHGGECQRTSMRLLKHIAIGLNLSVQWQAYSWYYDSSESSEIRQGTEKEIRALFSTDF